MIRLLKDRINEGYYDNKDDILILLLALQKQNYILANSLTNLVQKWNIIEGAVLKSGISSGIKS